MKRLFAVMVLIGVICLFFVACSYSTDGSSSASDGKTQQTIAATAVEIRATNTAATATAVSATSVAATATAAAPSPTNDNSQVSDPNLPVEALVKHGTLGKGFFSPYKDVSVGAALHSVALSTGQKNYTLAFIDGNGCKAEWAGTIPLDQTSTYLPDLDNDIHSLRSQGGDVTISFGGQAGQELAQTCSSSSNLQAQYQAVVDHYSAKHLDFDIEGGGQADATTYDRRNTALAALQFANPGLTISFTLPSATTGLLSDSMGLLNNALSHGVNFGIVNLMTMDYGGANSDMGQSSIDAANGLYAELQGMFHTKSPADLWSMVGITPMVGHNDSQGEVFSPDDAQKVLTFAQQNKIGELAMWEVSRDNGSCASATSASPTCSGISQSDYAFINIFKGF